MDGGGEGAGLFAAPSFTLTPHQTAVTFAVARDPTLLRGQTLEFHFRPSNPEMQEEIEELNRQQMFEQKKR